MLRRNESSKTVSSEGGEDQNADKMPINRQITEGHDSFDLIFMMLMGIRTSVGKFANVPSRELRPSDFDQKWDGDFLAKGSSDTPAHGHQDFRFKDFSPLVFRKIRERFGVMTEDYLLSLTSEYVLVEMFTNSKSGSFFFYSADYRFILKTCTKREAAFLIAALPQYHAHLMSHRYTLLCRFFGLHRVHLPGTALGKKVYFAVMGNVFPIDKDIHERYDLKGSTRGRVTSEEERQDPNVVLKDLDWLSSGRKLHLGEDKKRRLLAQVKKDTALLERLEVIDYSLLVGIHRATATRQPSRENEGSRFYKVASGKSTKGKGKGEAQANSSTHGSRGGGSGGGVGRATDRKSDDGGDGDGDGDSDGGGGGSSGGGSSALGGGSYSKLPLMPSRNMSTQSSARADTSSIRTEGEEPSSSSTSLLRQGSCATDSPEELRGASVQIVDTVSQQQLHREHAKLPLGEPTGRHLDRSTEPEEPEVGKEIYFIGCIDILCEYGLKKQLEHHYKAAKHGEKVGAQNFSVVDPVQYSTRFYNFVAEALD